MDTQATTPFYCLWQEENEPVRDQILDLLPRHDLASLRLASSACCNITTKRLFKRINVIFNSNTFTKHCRVQALSRIGHHVEHLTFDFAHSMATFLPPLVHPSTGAEICFLYTPHTSMASVLARPKYANTELGEILTQQYPPLFHAASNVPSFINAIKHLSNLRHLTVRTPGQDPRERYRRDAVDYALISLRIAIERCSLLKLERLSLSHLHPSALHYLRAAPGGSFGALPSSQRRWRQIRKLSLALESWDFADPASPGRDHLKIVDDYLRALAPTLEKLSFQWLGLRGPCPLALSADPLFAPLPGSRKLFNEVTSPMSPLPVLPGRGPIYFARLRRLSVHNASMNEQQVAGLMTTHRDTVREVEFEDVALAAGGSWKEALAPLTNDASLSGRKLWSQHSRHLRRSRPPSSSISGSLHSMPSRDELPSTPSAAVAAVSRELLDHNLSEAEYGGKHEFEAGELGQDALVEMSGDDFEVDEIDKGEGDDGRGGIDELEAELASEIAAARDEGMAYTTKLRKKRRKRKHSQGYDGKPRQRDEEQRKGRSRGGSESTTKSSRSRSRSEHSGHRKHKRPNVHTKSSTESVAKVEAAPPSVQHVPVDSLPSITAPIMDASPQPVLLQPTVYDPNRPSSASSLSCASSSPSSAAAAAAVRTLAFYPDEGISSVQRNIEQEEARRVLAEDAAARTSALRKAKESVLAKLSQQFARKQRDAARPACPGGLGPNGCAMSGMLREGLLGRSQPSMCVLPDERAVSSQSALVPLMFTRS